ncbi:MULTISPECIES: acyl-ACP desaturase [Mycobacteroides]|jgi:acyl-[acyl-carrier-protein] desaturase|uniref:Acyl-ACP desaturase n=1 Tax=Mycobacteroides chelonae TaxID=1774 RepID=A0A1S1LPU4_MYCCH|nr:MULTISPECIES: acyl-ACP desaturase [Mycobacteroides]KRQ18898.1 acyl-ACP desaturase [Mycobacteroides sp. H003]KRQ21329.1 acyl-ACP desaturase [Mycobacteroides sp. H092]KRQ44379.1 acyl-ACP desaturase [Mycobacteroides sp. H101]KRQ52409.1 acyl-ACP desaturase [Mycobacteroides sp. H063]KRQ57149.1 acyl-ACP desaturase [Mycobacteroides sp. HXVII]
MQKEFTDLELLHELEPVVEENVHRHLAVTRDWSPHDYVPWSEGKNYKALGGQDWNPEQSKLSELAKVAMITNLLTEDNLPSYHREIAMNFTMDGPWGTWVNRWTAEENRHGIAIRDYLVVTRSVDPFELEKLRVEQMTRGFSPGQNRQGGDLVFAETLFDSVVYVTFQELATRVSHRNTGKACAEPIADELLKRISTDENLHMIFYRNMVEAGMAIAPDQALRAVHKVLDNFTMPGYTIPGFRRNAVTIATGGVYDPQSHLEEVVLPVLRKWRIFERDDISREAEWYREDLARIVGDLRKTASDFEEVKAKYLDRQAKRAERQSGKSEMLRA